MADKVGEEEESKTWGTWEELLLVSAVNRHGTKKWESVAMEIQNRITSSSSSSSSPNFILTPHNCKTKYEDLRYRFTKNESEIDNNLDDCLEELRKLRVAELRREVQQYDVSIVSLQLKVKRLKEEREKDEVKLDLKPEPPEKPEPEKPISGEDSDRENQSFNESNSTDPKRVVKVDESDKKHETVEDPVNTDSPEDKPAGEGSYNGSSETIRKDSVSKAFDKSSDPKTEPGESPELWESATDLEQREEERAKENSDVQSSASLSRRKKDTSVSSSGEEPETDEISPAIKRISVKSVKSHPLGKLLEVIKSHRYGYVFERRLESQETSKYKSMIRQHLDIETIHKRLKAGQYSGCSRKFFRDMLLLINNAIVFFPNNSTEVVAAIELRQIIQKELGSRIRKTTPSPATQLQRVTTTTNVTPPSQPKADPEASTSLLAKAKSSVPMIACRKRSSISSKGPSGLGEKKVEKKEAVIEEKKIVTDRKPQDNGVTNLEQIVIKKGKRDRPASGARSSRPVGKNSNSNKHPSSNPNQNPNPSPNPNPAPNPNPSSSSKGGTPTDDVSDKADKEKKGNLNTVAKKRSVANFLDRMQKNNSPSNGTLLESMKNSGNNPSNSKGSNAEQKKNSNGKGDSRKEQATTTKQSSSKKHSREKGEKGSPPKRSVGRPPKRNASSSSPATPPPPPSKRSREAVEMEGSGSRQPRKRSRR